MAEWLELEPPNLMDSGFSSATVMLFSWSQFFCGLHLYSYIMPIGWLILTNISPRICDRAIKIKFVMIKIAAMCYMVIIPEAMFHVKCFDTNKRTHSQFLCCVLLTMTFNIIKRTCSRDDINSYHQLLSWIIEQFALSITLIIGKLF